MLCQECSSEFQPRFEGQMKCPQCYYAEHPDKDFIREHRERLYDALGVNHFGRAKKYNRVYSDFCPEDGMKGISDDELVFDEEYAGTAAQPTSQTKGYRARSSKWEVGKVCPNGAVFMGKQPLKQAIRVDLPEKTSSRNGSHIKII